jgi:hypothetical protein
VASFLASFFFHLSLLLVLALVFEVRLPPGFSAQLVASMEVDQMPETLVPLGLAGSDKAPDVISRGAISAEQVQLTTESIPKPVPFQTTTGSTPSAGSRVAMSPSAPGDLLLAADTDLSGAMAGRGRDARAKLALYGGGSPQSEMAVERGLRWLMAHQHKGGGWRFDLGASQCQGACRNPGKLEYPTAATALGLLPFLGAGYTHREGEYQEVVRRGIYYLLSQAKKSGQGLDLQQGTMYGQGLSALVLCEAYAMTGDETLKEPAQKALNFIAFAQDKQGGGWRYDPGKPGDTTVSGWQLMALKSGQMARLSIPSPAIGLVKKFLDSVQYEAGARYKYMATGPRDSHTTTAIGLLMRMYTGWDRNAAMYRGIGYLLKWGPSTTDIYYNFYAAQVVHHWGGPEWDAWNSKLRDYLVRTQAGQGHEAGSWHFPDPNGDQAGRLYSTAMAVMTLEVYYRFLPLYGRQSLRETW